MTTERASAGPVRGPEMRLQPGEWVFSAAALSSLRPRLDDINHAEPGEEP